MFNYFALVFSSTLFTYLEYVSFASPTAGGGGQLFVGIKIMMEFLLQLRDTLK